MTATNTTRSHSGGTHSSTHWDMAFRAPPQAPPSTHWDMAVRCPAPSPTLHSLGHDCMLAFPEPPGTSFQTVNIPNVITRHGSKKATTSNGLLYFCNVAVRLGEAEPAKMAQRSHCSTLCTNNTLNTGHSRHCACSCPLSPTAQDCSSMHRPCLTDFTHACIHTPGCPAWGEGGGVPAEGRRTRGPWLLSLALPPTLCRTPASAAPPSCAPPTCGAEEEGETDGPFPSGGQCCSGSESDSSGMASPLKTSLPGSEP